MGEAAVVATILKKTWARQCGASVKCDDRNGQELVALSARSRNAGPRTRELDDICPEDEPRVPNPAGQLPKAADDYTEAPSGFENGEKSAYHRLLSGLRERYREILSRRTNYVNLMSFLFFTAFYGAILYYQRRAVLGYDVHKSLTYLLPSDGDGGVVSEFRSIMGVYNWLETLVNGTWIDPICGNGMCDMPVEEAAYGRFGCQEDCGWREDLLQVTIDLSYMFTTDDERTSSLWNICKEGLCSPSSVDPSSSSPLHAQSCYFLHAGTFTYMEGNVSAAVYLPLSSQWEFCLVTKSVIMPVTGTVSQVYMSKGERTRRSSERDGFLGEFLVDMDVKDLYGTSTGRTSNAPPPPALSPDDFPPLDTTPPFTFPPDLFLVLGSPTLGVSPALGSPPLGYSSVDSPATGRPMVASATPAGSPGLASDGSGSASPVERISSQADGSSKGTPDLSVANGAADKDGTAASDVNTLRAASGASGFSNHSGAVSARLAGGPGVVRLQEWTLTRELSPCQTDCLAVSACIFRCTSVRPTVEAELNTSLEPLFDTSALSELCESQMRCDAQPERRMLQSMLLCNDPFAFLNWVLRGASVGDDPRNPTFEGSDKYAPWFNGTVDDIYALATLIRDCQQKLWFVELSPQEEVPTCAPGCHLRWSGNLFCEQGCLTEFCEYDFADCCVQHRHYNGDHHYHCPLKGSHPWIGGQMFQVRFTVPSVMDTEPIIGVINDTTAGSPTPPPGARSAEDLRWRMAGVTNRIVAGIVIKQHRTPLQPAPTTKKFRSLFNLDFDMGGSGKPFGSNPYFLRESAMYVKELVYRTHDFFTREQLSEQGVPFAFFPLRHRGRDVFPIFIDMSTSQEQALAWLEFLQEATFLDAATEEVEVEIVTYNGILEYFGLCVVSFRREPGGVVSITSTVQMFSLDMYNTPAERVRGVGEVLLVLMVIAGTLFELQQVVSFAVETGSLYGYFANVANVIDLTSISLFYASIALWARFLIKYHGDFNIQLSYQPYRRGFGSDGERLAKMLDLAENGDVMRELLDRFEEVQDISRSVDVYSFLTALNLLFLLFRILKLTDFHPRLGIVTHTLTRAMNDIAHYLLVASILFLSFAVMGHLSFGTSVAEFSTLSNSFNTCFLMIIGEVGINYELMVMQGLQLAMAWIFFWLYMTIMYFILINFFIAFIIDSFSDHMSSGARVSSTVAQDLREIFRDAARQAWALLTCQVDQGRKDTSIAAKLEALATLTADTVNAGASATGAGDRTHAAVPSAGCDIARGEGKGLRGVGEESTDSGGGFQGGGANDMRGGNYVRFVFEVDNGGVHGDSTLSDRHGNNRPTHRKHGSGGAVLDDPDLVKTATGVADDSGHADGVTDGKSHEGGDGFGAGTSAVVSSQLPAPGASTAIISRVPSRVFSLVLPGGWRSRMQVQKQQQQQAIERRVVINGCPFTEDEIAKLLLDGMRAATLAGGQEGEESGEDGTLREDPADRSLRSKARKLLFGSGAAGSSDPRQKQAWEQIEGMNEEAAKSVNRRAGLAPRALIGSTCGRVTCVRSPVEDEVDLESPTGPPGVRDPARGGASAAAWHGVAREISSHAIWRFGTTAAEQPGDEFALAGPWASARAEAGPGLSDASVNRFPSPAGVDPGSDPTVQVARMVGALQAELVEMEARWTAVLSQLARPGEGQQQQQQLAGSWPANGEVN